MNIKFIINLNDKEKELMVRQCIKEFRQADKSSESLDKKRNEIVDNREELKLDDLKLPELSKVDHDKISATGTIKMTPEIDNWFKDMEALAIVQTWRKLKEAKHE